MQSEQQRLIGGLRVRVIHDPQATRAAALLQVAAGSLHEPDAWPGLAHLLEHMLFAGSRAFQGDERLMAWLPGRGGRLNATTRDADTAFFFECTPSLLPDALRRLSDMLAAPLLQPQAIAQEVATIDAECALLADRAETLCDAALSAAFAGHPWQRFRVGDRAHFGEDTALLQQALQRFHRTHYRAERCTLWLQGPQPPEALWLLAEDAARQFAAGDAQQGDNPLSAAGADAIPRLPGLRLSTQRRLTLQLPAGECLRFSFLTEARFDAELTLLRQLLLDEAEGSLMAALREAGLADGVRLLLPYQTPQQQLVCIEFSGGDRQDALTLAAWLHHWLAQLALLSERQRDHYASLALRQFSRQAPLEQLRERALSFPPAVAQISSVAAQTARPAERWQALLGQLSSAGMVSLTVTRQAVNDRLTLQGFPLSLAVGPATPDKPAQSAEGMASAVTLRFFPQARQADAFTVPDAAVILPHHGLSGVSGSEDPVLLLSPTAPLPAPWGDILLAGLRPLAGNLAHQGGRLLFSDQQGLWLLQLAAAPALLLSTLAAVNVRLGNLPAAAKDAGQREAQRRRATERADIAVRALLAELPALLQENVSPLPADGFPAGAWQAALYGGSQALRDDLARLLTLFPAAVNPAAPAHKNGAAAAIRSGAGQARPAAGKVPSTADPGADAAAAQALTPLYQGTYRTVTTDSREHALLLFCPPVTPGAECLAAWQLLAACYAQPFFQQLRVEQNIGYAVSCRFYQAAEQCGILFILQSPHLPAAELSERIVAFLQGMTQPLAALTPQILQARSATLLGELEEQPAEAMAQSLRHWQQQRYGLNGLSAAHFSRLTPQRLLAWHQRLIAERSGWCQVSNAGPAISG